MDKNVKSAVEAEDLKRLAVLLDEIAKLPDLYAFPKEWDEGANGWSAIAKKGAEAARAGKFSEARQSCKGCHKPYRKKFEQSDFRIKPLPKGWGKTK
ncbi:MAG: hypothetical protein IPJ88_01005 [Myxococcales bacterium]|nr:MAG: hypothetical protein IPJ88_01005 [Myxococcales bacterium]